MLIRKYSNHIVIQSFNHSPIMRKLTSIFLSFLILFSSFAFLFVSPTLAQGGTPPATELGPWYNQSPQQWFAKVFDNNNPQEIFGERYTFAQVQWIVYSLAALPLSGAKDLVNCYTTGDSGNCVQGVFGVADASTQPTIASAPKENIFQAVFSDTRPISLISYSKDKASNLHIVPETHAQTGFGFGALNSVQSLWGASRNLAYSLYILIILVMAFMVMFRVRLSAQTVVSVQSSLPKIAITLLLVTFSYAIAGFLIDLMYVVIGLIAVVFAQSNTLPIFNADDPTAVFNFMANGGLTFPGAPDAGQVPTGVFGILFYYFLMFITGVLFVFLFGGGIFGLLITGGAGLLISAFAAPFLPMAGIIAVILVLVLILIFLYSAFKILWTLLKAFAFILILTITAPVQIGLGAIYPSKSLGFGNWVRSYISNLAVFPTVGLMFALSYVFMGQAFALAYNAIGGDIANAVTGNWGPFQTQFSNATSILGPAGTSWPPLLGVVNNGQFVGFILISVSLSIMLLTPKAADVVKAMMTGSPFPYGTAVGTAMSGPYSQYEGYVARRGKSFDAAAEAARAAGAPVPTPPRGLPAQRQAIQQISHIKGMFGGK